MSWENYEGAGHTLAIHSRDEQVVREFGLKKPVSRVIVNAGSSLGGVGGTTGLLPSLTLGCGAVGHNATSDNVGPLNLLNVRRVAWGLREIGELYPASLSQEGGKVNAAGMDALVNRIVDELAVRHSAWRSLPPVRPFVWSVPLELVRGNSSKSPVGCQGKAAADALTPICFFAILLAGIDTVYQTF